MAWTIYTKNGDERVVSWSVGEVMGDHTVATANNNTTPVRHHIHPDLEYNGEWMGESFVTLTIRSAVPVDFEIGDYVIYRGEKFVMNYDPTVVKKARRGTYGEGFTYDNVKFNALSCELTDVRMLDYVLKEDIHYSSLPNFNTFCATVDDLADRLQANTDRYCAANDIPLGDWWVFVTPDYNRSVQRCGQYHSAQTQKAIDIWNEYFYHKDPADEDAKIDQNVNVSNMSVWDTMKYIKETFGYHFITRGRSVIIGAPGVITNTFEYGKGLGLYEIERTADSEQQIVTKLFAYGSDKNMPMRYYANLCTDCYAPLRIQPIGSGSYKLVGIPASKDYFRKKVDVTYMGSAETYEVTITVNSSNTQYTAYVSDTSGVDPQEIVVPSESFLWSNGPSFPTLHGGDVIHFVDGIRRDSWPSMQRKLDDSYPSTLSLNVLMLPGFPKKSLYDWVIGRGEGEGHGTAIQDDYNTDLFKKALWTDSSGVDHIAYFSCEELYPCILSANYYELGIREATKFFDGSDGDVEIYPTIENTGVDTIVEADAINDNGVYDESEPDNFHITLPDLGFALDEYLTSEATINMKSGYCGGREFSIEKVEQNESDEWVCEVHRDQDNDLGGLYFPYRHHFEEGDNTWPTKPYQLLPDDKYVLTGIDMPDEYISINAERLLEAALIFLEKNCDVRYTYVPRIDELFMARENDAAHAQGELSLYDTLKEGDLMDFRDSDLNIEGYIYIDNLRIKEYGNGQIPTFEVTLRNDKQVGSIQRMQEQINSLTNVVVSGGGTGGGGVNVPQTKQLIENYGKDLFLSKRDADTAAGTITFNNGIALGSKGLTNIIRHDDTLTNSDTAVLSERKALETLLRKDIDELMPFLLRFRVGIESEHYQTGDQGVGQGFALKQDGAGHFFLEIDDVNVRRKLTVSVLDVKRTMFSQGPQVLTNANGTIKGIVPLDANGNEIGISIFGYITDDGQFMQMMVRDNTYEDAEEAKEALEYADSYKLYFLASDGDKTLYDFWRTGDLALCRELNVTSQPDTAPYDDNVDGVQPGQQMSNHHWHRLVTDHGTETLGDSSSSSSDEEEKVYHYITVSNRRWTDGYPLPKFEEFTITNDTDWRLYPSSLHYSAWTFDGTLQNTVPAVGDDVVQYGSVIDADRREATTMSPSSKGGVLSHIKGIGSIRDYTADKNKAEAESGRQYTHTFENIHLGDTVSITADSFYISTSNAGQEERYPIPVQMPDEFVPGTDTASYYQQWTYQGQQWLCINSQGTSDTPSGTSPDWRLAVAKGADGSAVRRWIEYAPSEIHVDGNGVVQSDTNVTLRFFSQTGAGSPQPMDGSIVDAQLGVTVNAIMVRGSDTLNYDSTYYANELHPGFYTMSGYVRTFIFKAGDILQNLEVSYADYPDTMLTLAVDGNDGKDAWVLQVEPNAAVIEETLVEDGTSYETDDNYFVTQWTGASVQLKAIHGLNDVTSEDNVSFSFYGIQYITYYDKDGVSRSATNTISASFDSNVKGKVNIYAGNSIDSYQNIVRAVIAVRCTVTEDNVPTYFDNTITVFINRMGTYISKTVGDVTVEMRTKTQANAEGIVTLSETLTETAEGIERDYKIYVNGQLNSYSTTQQTADMISTAVGTVDGRVSTIEQTADYIRLGVDGVSNGNVLEQTNWNNETIQSNYTVALTNRGEWDEEAIYNRFDKVYSGPGPHYYVLVGAATMTGGTDPYVLNDPSVWLEYYETGTIDKWACENIVWPVSNAYNKYTAYHVLRPVYNDNESKKPTTSRLKQTVYGKLTTNTVYTLSFYYRSSSQMFLNMSGFININATLKDKNNNSGGILFNEFAVPLGTARSDIRFENANPVLGNTQWAWKYVSITFKTLSSIGNSAYLGFDAYSHQDVNTLGEFEIVMVKLEKGTFATPWNDIPSALKRSGIDITREKIVATTDHFEIQNSSGQKTFGIDADGNLTATGSAKFSGTVEAKILYTTFGEYGITPTEVSQGYVDYTALPYPLPQRLVLQTGIYTYPSTSFTVPSVNVHMPPASAYQGLEIEIFFLGRYKEVTSGSTNYIPEIFIAPESGHFCDLFRNDTVTAVKQSASASEESIKRTCKVRLLSVYDELADEWSWMVMEVTRGYCEYEQ